MNEIQNVDYEKMKLHFTFVYFGFYNTFLWSDPQTRYALDQKNQGSSPRKLISALAVSFVRTFLALTVISVPPNFSFASNSRSNPPVMSGMSIFKVPKSSHPGSSVYFGFGAFDV